MFFVVQVLRWANPSASFATPQTTHKRKARRTNTPPWTRERKRKYRKRTRCAGDPRGQVAVPTLPPQQYRRRRREPVCLHSATVRRQQRERKSNIAKKQWERRLCGKETLILVYRDTEPATTTQPKESWKKKKRTLHVHETEAAPSPLKGSRLLCFPSPHRPPGYRERVRERKRQLIRYIYICTCIWCICIHNCALCRKEREQAIAAENTDEFQS